MVFAGVADARAWLVLVPLSDREVDELVSATVHLSDGSGGRRYRLGDLPGFVGEAGSRPPN